MKPASPSPWLLQLVVKPLTEKPPGPGAKPTAPKSKGMYGQVALDREVQRLGSAPLHQRNNTLNRCAFRLGQLVATGYLGEPEVVRQLTQAATQVELESGEIPKTIRSGIAAGKRFPRHKSPPREKHPTKQVDGSDGDSKTAACAKLDCTDADNAVRFVKRYGNRFAYCPNVGWLYFSGKCWLLDNLRKRVLAGMQTARRIADEAGYLTDKTDQQQRVAHSKRSLSKAALDRMLDLAAPMMTVEVTQLDADPLLLNVLNGTIDLRTGRLRSHNPRDMITKLAPVTYPKAPAPSFKMFMRRVLKGNVELYRYLQQAVGYTLTGVTTEQLFLYLRGRQANGKSTFVNTVRDMLGNYGAHTPTQTLLVKTYDNNIPNDLARLKGARMVTAIEAPPGRQLNEAAIKAMTGGDPITARFMRAEFFEFVPEFKLWFVANDDPRVRSTDDALWRRIRVIPFDVIIPEGERDPDLPHKLRAEWPGILAWAVRGCLALQQNGLHTPEAVLEATTSYRKRADHLIQFFRECVIQEEHAEIAASVLHRAYADWCTEHHERPLSTAKFKQQLEDFGHAHTRTNTGSFWRNLRLRR